ncbi:MAG: helix-turn-helix domain-containing protein [Planctomycetota bacterium]|nr:helix-turn-helix domain-containing protein [Planctomycetota bacterium]
MKSSQPSPKSDGQLARLQALASPARLELVEALQVGGASTAADLAARLGRAPDSLYHHLRQLEAAGIVARRGSRATGGRRSAVFDLVPGAAAGGGDGTTGEAERAGIASLAAAVLRLTERDVGTCLGPRWGDLVELVDDDAQVPAVSRSKAWLTAAELTELADRLAALQDFLRARLVPPQADPALGATEPRSLFALTLALTPLWPSPR